MTDTAADFVRSYAALAPVPFLPEIKLHQADEPIGLWELTEGEYRSEQPPPFWAFAWAGGQALARYVFDHPETTAGKRVLDLAAGSGLVAVTAALTGAATVRAVDIDPLSAAAIELNAAANGVQVSVDQADILGGDAGDAEVVLAGDVFYSQAMADRMTGFLRRAVKNGARVLVGDPDRAFLPKPLFHEVAAYDVPTPFALESVTVKHTRVWELRGPAKA
ncbi:class I SAM-dependent methyltransferase [Catellatospora citrea]|uniref:Ribosomal protein L11 methyltransferase n=1 Tax=Catellatospora citrea TaxID=53366 RepID=A0A8J3KSK3_9ACTN|nr:50S ribosomal protein L11 methyltransferase [Catellatospora citrea]RKE11601.1 putative nicotinamide N-methyase [Catellatospora citrea]GIG02406.1 ribosomal protein L11 methyltransferase [Catellatospora citrea]